MWIWLLYQPHVPRNNALQLFSMYKSFIYFTVAMYLQFYDSVFRDSSLEVQPLLMHPCAHCVVSACNGFTCVFILQCVVLSIKGIHAGLSYKSKDSYRK